MPAQYRPHVLGIDDGPFDKFESETTPIVGVMMEGADLVEAVAITAFPVDGEDVTPFLADWIENLRFRPALQGILLGGITIAGLCVVDALQLAQRVRLPVVITNRREPSDEPLRRALHAAGLPDRIPIVDHSPRPFRLTSGLYAALAGESRQWAEKLLRSTRAKSDLPEPLRLAHMIARAIASGESRGRP